MCFGLALCMGGQQVHAGEILQNMVCDQIF